MGTVYVVATPIGNLEDITVRAIKTLFAVDIIACEDTRNTGNLMALLKKQYPEFAKNGRKQELVRYDDHTEHSKTPELIESVVQGKTIALVSDSGTPLVSDPGYQLVYHARKRDIPVVSVPGPSAAVAALSVAGIYTNQFYFLGYLPEKETKRKAALRQCCEFSRTNSYLQPTFILYVSPHKFIRTLTDMQELCPDMPVVIARELTKIHEEIWHGTVSEALKEFSTIKGELVLLFHPGK